MREFKGLWRKQAFLKGWKDTKIMRTLRKRRRKLKGQFVRLKSIAYERLI